MKKLIKLALAAVILFSFAACDLDDDPIDPNGVVITFALAENSTFGNSTINAVAYGDGKFVAVGDGGKIAYSTDGENWTAAENTTFTAAINCVAWGGGKFLAAGANGRMAFSPDGITWTAVNNSTFGSNEIIGVSWGSNKWVAVGRSWMAYSTEDGSIWAGKTSNDPFSFVQGAPVLRDVVFGNNRFVLVGAAGGQGHGASLAHSSNGVSWTARDMEDIIAVPLLSICYGNGKFVSVSMDAILYSTNGSDWNDTEDGSLGKQLRGVAAGGNKFIAVGSNSAILQSSDGIDWSELENSLSSNFNGITYGNGTWVIVGANGAIAYSE